MNKELHLLIKEVKEINSTYELRTYIDNFCKEKNLQELENILIEVEKDIVVGENTFTTSSAQFEDIKNSPMIAGIKKANRQRLDNEINFRNLLNEKINELNLNTYPATNTNYKERGKNIPFKIVLLKRLGVIDWLNNNVKDKSNHYRIISVLIGGNEDNIRKYLTNSLPIDYDTEKQAKEFLNSKIY